MVDVHASKLINDIASLIINEMVRLVIIIYLKQYTLSFRLKKKTLLACKSEQIPSILEDGLEY